MPRHTRRQPPSLAAARPLRRFMGVAAAAILAASWLPVTPVRVAALAVSPPAASAPDGRAAPRPLSAEVVGYLPYWEMTDATFADIDLSRLTTITLFSVGWNSAGRLGTTAPGYQAITRADTRAFVDAAQSRGVEVLVSFTSFGVSKNAAFFSNPAARATFVSEAAAFVAANGLDGADLDVELIQGVYFDEYAATAASLRNALRAADDNARVTVATNGNTSGARMAAQALAAGVDRAFLMGYSYRSAGSTPGSIDPIARRAGDTGLSLTASLDLYAANDVPMGKVILGLPLYGRSWPTVDARLGSPRRSGISGSGATFRVRQLAQMRATGRILVQDTVPVELSARLVRRVGTVVWQSFYDSANTLKAKMRLVKARGLAGTGFWALGYSNGRPEYWAAIGEVFGPPAIAWLRIIPSPTRARAVTIRLGWRDGAGTATEIRIANGNTFGPWRPIASSHPWTLPAGPAVSSRIVRVQIRDDSRSVSAVVSRRVLYDRARPALTRLTMAWSPAARAWSLRYAGRDVGSGVAGYRITLKRDGVYSTLAALRVPTGYLVRLPRSARFLITVRTLDRAGNISDPRFVGN